MGQPVKKQVIQFQVCFLSGGSPPEPPAARFMQRPPQHRHPGLLQPQQLRRHRVDIPVQKPVSLFILSVHNPAQVEASMLGIKARIPGFLQIGRWCVPVPAEGHDPALVPVFNRVQDRLVALTAMLHAAGGIIDHVQSENRGIITARCPPDCLVFHSVHSAGTLLAGKDLFPVAFPQPVIQLPRFR